MIEEILSQTPELRQRVRMSDDRWAATLESVGLRLGRLTTGDTLIDEQVWTFLVAVGFASSGDEGMRILNSMLTGSSEVGCSLPVWFEALPMPPRLKEGNTNLDLAAGFVQSRGAADGGIELSRGASSWVCFVEAKWYSDLSTKVTNHVERNQLARVIENALAFQSGCEVAGQTYVTLLTPRRFRDGNLKSRLFRYKYDEYVGDPTLLLSEFAMVGDRLPIRSTPEWRYPDMINRIETLQLGWVTYEELIDAMPSTELGALVSKLSAEHGDPWSAP